MLGIPSEETPVFDLFFPGQKHLGKAPSYFPLLEIWDKTWILKAKESCLTLFSAEFPKPTWSSTPIFSPKEHIVI